MKLAFTTLGCPDWDMDTIISRAVEYGFDGVDFRGYGNELDIYKLPEFAARAQETAARFAEAGLEVPCFSSSAYVYRDPEKAIREITAYAALCLAFGSSCIRIFGGNIDDTPREEAIRTAVRTLRQAAPIARDHNVKLVLETHDAWTETRHVAAVLEAVDSPAVGALWDINHPYRFADEDPETSWKNIGPWVAYTHWKDSITTPEGKHPFEDCLFGQGDLPLGDILGLLRSGGYDGYLTLEWEKKWNASLEEPEVAFPAYVARMRKLLADND